MVASEGGGAPSADRHLSGAAVRSRHKHSQVPIEAPVRPNVVKMETISPARTPSLPLEGGEEGRRVDAARAATAAARPPARRCSGDARKAARVLGAQTTAGMAAAMQWH